MAIVAQGIFAVGLAIIVGLMAGGLGDPVAGFNVYGYLGFLLTLAILPVYVLTNALGPRPRAPGGDRHRPGLPARPRQRWLSRPLTPADVTGVYVGLRPLVGRAEHDTARISREHVVRTPLPGLVSVVGGKYTTYRVMARDAIDAAAAELDVPVAESPTQSVPLVGADGLLTASARVRKAAPDAATAERLLRRYGSRAGELLDAMAADPSLAAAIPGTAYTMAEARYVVTHEGALMLDDVLARRTRTSIEARDRGRAAAEPVARLIAPELGWDETRITAEVGRYHRRLDAEKVAQAAFDDDSADAARRRVRDPRIAV